jgi:hypothetical protein
LISLIIQLISYRITVNILKTVHSTPSQQK